MTTTERNERLARYVGCKTYGYRDRVYDEWRRRLGSLRDVTHENERLADVYGNAISRMQVASQRVNLFKYNAETMESVNAAWAEAERVRRLVEDYYITQRIR